MAHLRPMSDWKRVWWFPWRQRRFIGLYLDTAPNTLVDINSCWFEYRWTP